ncbi:HD-GYP domain-containing protein [Geomesophilobacter sediminis]|uniref:HD domain-containing protein n=1 Tax=Geomesophilobacter sediminis TaxID=2798584 RepID=A0A8J7IVW4_9BACT|nr:HD domain-containing phosphohydrolase [Geomesophilobacter sediminis]MBJ6723422.1 HD domain-containing protein [Geomesophilobacter sediminis]
MFDDLCQMALRQTLELVSLTDEKLRGLTRRKLSREETYREVLGKVLGGKGRRGPSGIFIATEGPECTCCNGRVFHLREHELIESSDEISIDPGSSYALGLLSVEGSGDAVAVNWMDICNSVDDFQVLFHPQVTDAMEEPILNFVSSRISGETTGVLVAFNYPGRVTEYDADVLKSAATVMGSLLTVSQEMQETEQAFHYTVSALARACEAAEEDTGKHIVRVNRYAGALAANMGFNTSFVEDMAFFAQMHDVGKIRVPVEILLKEGPLDDRELQIMRQHPAYGEEIIGKAPRLMIAREIAIAHHENWDGSGYPKRLKGERIPIPGRIVKVADVYDALRSRRSYKVPLSHQEALQVFREGDERINPAAHFDPAVLATFFKIEKMFESIYESSILKLGLNRRMENRKPPGRERRKG